MGNFSSVYIEGVKNEFQTYGMDCNLDGWDVVQEGESVVLKLRNSGYGGEGNSVETEILGGTYEGVISPGDNLPNPDKESSHSLYLEWDIVLFSGNRVAGIGVVWWDSESDTTKSLVGGFPGNHHYTIDKLREFSDNYADLQSTPFASLSDYVKALSKAMTGDENYIHTQ